MMLVKPIVEVEGENSKFYSILKASELKDLHFESIEHLTHSNHRDGQ
jgi:hypothetical protein